MSLHVNNRSAAAVLEHLAKIVERDELTPMVGAECLRAVWEFEQSVNGCEMPGEPLVVVADLEYQDLTPTEYAATLRERAKLCR